MALGLVVVWIAVMAALVNVSPLAVFALLWVGAIGFTVWFAMEYAKRQNAARHPVPPSGSDL